MIETYLSVVLTTNLDNNLELRGFLKTLELYTIIVFKPLNLKSIVKLVLIYF